MRILKAVLLVLFGVLLGVIALVAWQSLMNPTARAVGVLKREPETHPAVSATYPPGYFVESRVYLETVSPDLLGQKVSTWGTLDLARDPDAPSYPKVRNKKLTVVR